ncbi:MAG: protein translocase subunit SecDF [Sphingobacteriales bacterium]|jgi:SecD/SecF fusion protein|nr:protein translocase subunit SecDF [Sphingobacteriales bacterium]
MGKGTRTALVILTALVVLICIYCLSFTFKVNSIEKNAVALAEKNISMQDPALRYPGNQLSQFLYEDSIHQNRVSYKNRYLDSISNEKVYLWNTYKACKEQQLNLGLDLQGGMSVVLQVSLTELLQSLSDNSRDPKFRQALTLAEQRMITSNDDYVTLFIRAFKELKPNDKLSTVFATRNNKDDINFESSDNDVEKFIRKQSTDAINRTYSIIQSRIDQFGTKQPTVTLEPNRGRITVEIAGVDNPARVRRLLQATANLEFWETYKATEIAKSINDANTALKAYLDTQKDLGKDSSVQSKAKNLLDEDSDATDSASVNPLSGAKNVQKDTSKAKQMEDFRNENPLFAVLQPAVDEQNRFQESPVIGYVSALDTATLTEYLNNPAVRTAFPKDAEFLLSAKPFGDKQKFYSIYVIKKNTNSGNAPLDGSVVTQARQDYDQNGQVVVSMQMNTLGGKTWRDLTRKNVGSHIAIVLDNQVYSAPVVNGEIDGGNSQISGGFDVQEAVDLANVLKTGKLPASARIIEEELVGPSLGKQSINAGLISMMASFLLVVVFMVFFYSSAGVVANLVLLLNLFMIIGLMAGFSSTLTLPGIAGIVLTLGMAVDANVIIYERVKEELREGKSLLISVEEGFKHSLSAILDGNITTFLTAAILFFVGLGPVKGFAVTLMIGIGTTLFTAVLLTKIIVDKRMEKGKSLNYFTPFTKNFLQGKNYDFIGTRKITYAISTVFIIIGLISFFTKGFELGIDFKGGREYKVRFEKGVNTNEVREALNATLGNGTVVKQFGSANQVKITTSYLIKKTGKEVDGQVEAAVYKGLNKFIPNTSLETFKRVNLMSFTKVDPTITGDFKRSSLLATVLSLVIIFIYILIRFRRYGYSIGAIVATAHDAFVVLALFSILHGILPFALEIDQTFIAAILTVIGYSLNDTVIIFDRLREYLKLRPNAVMKDTMNAAINSTLSRTFNTAFTVFIVVFILFLFGGSVLKGFSFAMLIGVVVGIYSSVFIASPIMYDLDRDHDKYVAAETKKKK